MKLSDLYVRHVGSMRSRLIAGSFAIALIGSTAGPHAYAQTDLYQTLVQIPRAVWPAGEPLRKDASASEELTANRTAMGVQTWGSLKAEGVGSLGRTENTSEAHLLLSGERWTRLEINGPSGAGMTMVDGKGGFLRSSAGTLPIDAQPFAPNSIPLQLLLSSHAFEALLDRGPITLHGVAMHRITVLADGVLANHGHEQPLDLYFDPSTHLLVMSVVSMRVPGGANELSLVTKYEDYRSAESMLFPHQIQQYLGGQPLWTLSLTSVKPGPKLDSSSFTLSPGR